MSDGRRADVDGLWAVVVNWNGGSEENARCLRSVVDQGVPPERIVFVDNASTDGSRDSVSAAFPGLVHVDNASNRGFGEAANQGAALALERGARAVVFVNNDLVFPTDQDVLGALVATLDDEARVGMVGPRVLYDDGSGRVWCAGGRLDYRQNLSTLLGHGLPDGPAWRVDAEVDYVPGCALVASRSCLDDTGLFDASYFAYMEDVELGMRARARGWRVRVLGGLRAYHAPSSSTGGGYGARRKWMQALNSVRFLKQHGRATHWLRFAAFDVATLPALFVARGLRGEGSAALAKAKGIWDGLRGRAVTADALEPGASRLWR
ncbi:MAG: glycosyltransferase family 2 protein [Planctomycetota bacterium]